MRNANLFRLFAIPSLLLVAASAPAATMDVKLGLWETTLNNRITGAPVGSNTVTYRTCLTQKQLAEDPIAQPMDKGQKCTTKMTSQTSTVWAGRRVCTGGEQGDQEYSGKVTAVSREHVKGALLIRMSTGGMAMTNHATYDSKWLGSDCGGVQ
jgi:Protein of unknown function (DUF3617)